MMNNMRGYTRRSGNYGQRTVCDYSNMCTDASPYYDKATTPKIAGTKTGTDMSRRNTPDACQLQKELMSQYFVMVELELYLDGHPNSAEALKRYQCAVDEFKETVARYETVFGPILARNNDCENEWLWVTTPWPWEV